MGMSILAVIAHAAISQSLFSIEVEPRIATEAGPIVFDVTATYKGAQPIEAYLLQDIFECRLCHNLTIQTEICIPA